MADSTKRVELEAKRILENSIPLAKALIQEWDKRMADTLDPTTAASMRDQTQAAIVQMSGGFPHIERRGRLCERCDYGEMLCERCIEYDEVAQKAIKLLPRILRDYEDEFSYVHTNECCNKTPPHEDCVYVISPAILEARELVKRIKGEGNA